MRQIDILEESQPTIRSMEIAVERLVKDLPPLLVGSRLKRARHAQGVSLRDLALSAGLSKNSITRLESGKDVRAITILKVCSALGLHVEMLRDPEIHESVAIHRLQDDRWYDLMGFGSGPIGGLDRPLTAEERAEFAISGSLIPLLRLKSRLSQGKVLPSILELHGRSEPRSHPGEEFVFVLKGTATITVSDTEYTLTQGESIDFWAEELHCYAPAGDCPALVLSVRVNP